MKFSKKRITKALIRLRGCAGWSATVLFANLRRQVFSRRGPFLKTLLTQIRLENFQRKTMPPPPYKCKLSQQACLLLFIVSQWYRLKSINYFKGKHAKIWFNSSPPPNNIYKFGQNPSTGSEDNARKWKRTLTGSAPKTIYPPPSRLGGHNCLTFWWYFWDKF